MTTRRNTSSESPRLLSSRIETDDTTRRLITEWRIQKRVEDQFRAFLSGFNELIPQELINVFDERELEVSPIASLSVLPLIVRVSSSSEECRKSTSRTG